MTAITDQSHMSQSQSWFYVISKKDNVIHYIIDIYRVDSPILEILPSFFYDTFELLYFIFILFYFIFWTMKRHMILFLKILYTSNNGPRHS